VPLHRLFDLPKPPAMPTAFTIGIDMPDAMAAMAKQIADYPLIKIKLGSDDDEARVRAVRAARAEARLIIDANAGWTLDAALANLKWLEKYNVELTEQPVAKDQHQAMGDVPKHRAIPIAADASGQTPEAVEKVG